MSEGGPITSLTGISATHFKSPVNTADDVYVDNFSARTAFSSGGFSL